MQYVTTPGTQGICPVGWHLPSDDEWCIMSTYIDPTLNCSAFGWSTADAGVLKEQGTAHWSTPNTGGTNESGFMALGAGDRTSMAPSTILARMLTSGLLQPTPQHTVSPKVCITRNPKDTGIMNTKLTGFSVRCIKDIPRQNGVAVVI